MPRSAGSPRKRLDVAGVPSVRLLRVNYVGELGWELHVPMPDMPKVFDALMAAGKAHGISLFGTYAMNSPAHGKGLSRLGLGTDQPKSTCSKPRWSASSASTRKISSAAAPASRASNSGARIKLVYLEVDSSDCDCMGNEPVYPDDRSVGLTTCGAYGHASGNRWPSPMSTRSCRRPALVLMC